MKRRRLRQAFLSFEVRGAASDETLAFGGQHTRERKDFTRAIEIVKGANDQ